MASCALDSYVHKRQKIDLCGGTQTDASRCTYSRDTLCLSTETHSLSNSCSSRELDIASQPTRLPPSSIGPRSSPLCILTKGLYVDDIPTVLARHAVDTRGVAMLRRLQRVSVEFHRAVRMRLSETFGRYTPADRREWETRHKKLVVGAGDRALFAEGRAVLLSVADDDRVVGVMIDGDGIVRFVNRKIMGQQGAHKFRCFKRTKDAPGRRMRVFVVSSPDPTMLVGRVCQIIDPDTMPANSGGTKRVNALSFRIVACSHTPSRYEIDTRRVDTICNVPDMLATAVVSPDMSTLLVTIVRQ